MKQQKLVINSDLRSTVEFCFTRKFHYVIFCYKYIYMYTGTGMKFSMKKSSYLIRFYLIIKMSFEDQKIDAKRVCAWMYNDFSSHFAIQLKSIEMAKSQCSYIFVDDDKKRWIQSSVWWFFFWHQFSALK